MAYSFTAYNDVRVVLGVSTKELPDTDISADIYTDSLQLAIHGLNESLEADYEAAALETTTEAKLFVAAFNAYAAYTMALFCVTGLPQFSPKTVTDGKAGFTRHSESPYKETVTRVQEAVEKYRRLLLEKYAVYKSETVEAQAPTVLVTASSLDTDPITGG